MTIIELSFRLILSFLLLLTMTRIMGRKEISQMTFFNFVSAIAIGTLGASLAIDSSISVRNGVFALAGWTIFTVVMGYADLKSKAFRKAVEGVPRVVVRKGEVMDAELNKVRLDLDALNVLLRKKNVFSIKEVDYAIFETDGTLSVMKKEKDQPLTKGDQQTFKSPGSTHQVAMPTALIEDGKIVMDSLHELHLDESWLKEQLTSQGITDMTDVFYAEIQKDGTLAIDRYNDLQH
ncbi:YetF domain-containing protein [Rossellomorea vietnamensis]|uniref:YetF domain-containing protein n=1 Tax=Rossellomorea vietnamensis TaxID=218284 RepID=UPI003D2E678A